METQTNNNKEYPNIENIEKFGVTATDRSLSETYKGFIRGGANLPAVQKEELKKINLDA